MLDRYEMDYIEFIMEAYKRLHFPDVIRKIICNTVNLYHNDVRKCLIHVFEQKYSLSNEIIQKIYFHWCCMPPGDDGDTILIMLREIQKWEREYSLGLVDCNGYCLGNCNGYLNLREMWTLLDMVDAWSSSTHGYASKPDDVIISNAFGFKRKILTCMESDFCQSSEHVRAHLLWFITWCRNKHVDSVDIYGPVVTFITNHLPEPPQLEPGISNDALNDMIDDALEGFDTEER
jgi:hypothetical protein